MPDLLLKKESPFAGRLQIKKGASLAFYGSLAAFSFALASYGGLVYANRSQLKTQEELGIQIRSKEAELRPELINQIFTLESRLNSIRGVLGGHVFTLNILKMLETDTLSKVRWVNFDLNTETRKIEMNGEASSYGVVTDQILLLERNPYIEKVEFGGLTLGSNNLVIFRITVTIKPSILKFGAI